MLAVFCSPSRYTQGKNATAALGTEMAGLGLAGPALIVASRSPIRLLSETWKRTFAEARMAYAMQEFGGECSLAEIERIKQAARQNKSQVVVGAGGGKVLDAARAAPPTSGVRPLRWSHARPGSWRRQTPARSGGWRRH